MKFLSMFLFVCMAALFSFCGKKATATEGTAPTNLVVNAVVSNDSSGNVSFTATATNATSFEYDFGNGIFQTSALGSLVYRYTAAGTYTVVVTAKSSSGQTISKSVQIIIAFSSSLLWADEFNVDGMPDASKWGYDIGAGGWGNNELQYYTNRTENITVSNGTLKVTAKKESYIGSAYTSARLISKGKYSVKYGKIEFRAKLPAGAGTWPALWMLGENISTVSWPACGEIDVMEHRGNEINRIFGTLHYPGHSGGNADGNSLLISNATTEFHKYSVNWTPSYVKIYVDDLLIHSVANSASLPFNDNFFFIINLALGGNFGGSVSPTFTDATLEVDYIRAYSN